MADHTAGSSGRSVHLRVSAESGGTDDIMIMSEEFENLLRDPISFELMDEPVVSVYGHTFDRETIISWVDKTPRCPMTSKPLYADDLTPNYLVKDVLHLFRQQRQQRLSALRARDQLAPESLTSFRVFSSFEAFVTLREDYTQCLADENLSKMRQSALTERLAQIATRRHQLVDQLEACNKSSVPEIEKSLRLLSSQEDELLAKLAEADVNLQEKKASVQELRKLIENTTQMMRNYLDSVIEISSDVVVRTAKLKESQELKDDGNRAYANGDLKEAIEKYTQAIDVLSPHFDAALHLNRAAAYCASKNPDASFPDLELVIAQEKKRSFVAKAHRRMGQAYLMKKQSIQALQCFSKALGIDPTDSLARANVQNIEKQLDPNKKR
eukprot:CAMPEP_0174238496 /NCGR_PEP_ID=MMETSP0417-20130205/11421_1 /TAXON_ID=242541 /ORGANISM="Mayorella sp, Strain BSH-02190019" /LENGTH=382 /DNA_ID=CAMNT_0015317337 /DNA_START=8 /DNA_END=1156 /DNA_ORIENTATION=+